MIPVFFSDNKAHDELLITTSEVGHFRNIKFGPTTAEVQQFIHH